MEFQKGFVDFRRRLEVAFFFRLDGCQLLVEVVLIELVHFIQVCLSAADCLGAQSLGTRRLLLQLEVLLENFKGFLEFLEFFFSLELLFGPNESEKWKGGDWIREIEF